MQYWKSNIFPYKHVSSDDTTDYFVCSERSLIRVVRYTCLFPVLGIFQTRNQAIVLCWSPEYFKQGIKQLFSVDHHQHLLFKYFILRNNSSFTCGSYRNLLCKPLLAFYLVAFRTYTISILVTSTVLCIWTRWRQSISNFTTSSQATVFESVFYSLHTVAALSEVRSIWPFL